MRKRPKPFRDPDMIKLAARVRQLTNESYGMIAAKAGLAPSTISNIDRGITRHPQHYTMVSLARAVGLRYELIGGNDEGTASDRADNIRDLDVHRRASRRE